MTRPGEIAWLSPDWPAAAKVRALTTFRGGGVSRGAYASLNLADHVGDDRESVAENRNRLARAANLPADPCWLKQIHGTMIIDAAAWKKDMSADAAYASASGYVLAVLTADCLPVLICDRNATWIAAIHAGWRGLATGVIEAAIGAFDGPRDQLLAWLGPAIGAGSFEVGSEVRDQFIAANPAASEFFRDYHDRWLADLYGLARQRLSHCGVSRVFGGGWCTFEDPTRFYSYRRDGRTGRMATLIWLA